MTIIEYQSKLDKMEKRLRLRDWLETKISDPLYPGLEWVNQQEKIFRIPWKHGGRHGWREKEDARLFREWSEHTGASPRDVKQHKANFRCALNSLRDVKQLQRMSKRKGDDAYRVYQMLPKVVKKKTTVWIKKRNKQSPSPISKHDARQFRNNSLNLEYFAPERSPNFIPPHHDWVGQGYDDIPKIPAVLEPEYKQTIPEIFPPPGYPQCSIEFSNYDVHNQHQHNDQQCSPNSQFVFPPFSADAKHSYAPMGQNSSPTPHYASPYLDDMSPTYTVFTEQMENSFSEEHHSHLPDGNPEDNDSVFPSQSSSPQLYNCYPQFDYSDSPPASWSCAGNEPVVGEWGRPKKIFDFDSMSLPQHYESQEMFVGVSTDPSSSTLPSASTLLAPLTNESTSWTCTAA